MHVSLEERETPYYAVIFTSKRTEGDHGYGKMADTMVDMAEQQPGFLGVESYRNAEGAGVTISYWSDLESIRNWKANPVHQLAQQQGKQQWYDQYSVKICKVERTYSFEA
ncbi:antibiotic biosynthesis monooxygenase [Paenibacillus hunanensis]|uniref:antibiotic biosynthesis monooxygenase family protein n=1 Tax=Paenibacillus hunanensis TaxID=539262 RepID=UPI002A6A30B9|nr:antibiotic biosynthesis monooxygenase [Paenibacillus hunanensis]WPP40208.1 antibiotic biosynthesis monooxygenase [Paenibacillus hunanensis]